MQPVLSLFKICLQCLPDIKRQANSRAYKRALVYAGEIMPDAGKCYICGHSMQREMAKARQLVGYCPQFDALPGTLTGLDSNLPTASIAIIT